jgi:MoaA/NifB/PqqE/SkfB family radical SAM enzyme
MVVGAGYTWSFVSNGMQTAPYEPLMLRYREQLTHVTLSLDGATPATHDAVRCRAGAFERVTAAARGYAEAGFPVRIHSTLNRLNRHELAAMVRLAQDLGASGFAAAGIIPTAWNQDLTLDDATLRDLYGELTALQTPDFLIHYFSSLHTSGGVHFCNNLHLRELTFNPRGELIFCCDTCGSGSAIGSLYHQPLGELIRLWLAQSAGLQQRRAELIVRGQADAPRFDHCAFCNAYFGITNNGGRA